jgi:hypothetical protein
MADVVNLLYALCSPEADLVGSLAIVAALFSVAIGIICNIFGVFAAGLVLDYIGVVDGLVAGNQDLTSAGLGDLALAVGVALGLKTLLARPERRMDRGFLRIAVCVGVFAGVSWILV